jgi:hypothetical protein
MQKLRALTIAAAAFALTATPALSAQAPPAPTGFTTASATVNNPWFPLKPGTTRIYQGIRDGKIAREVFKVTHRTKTILGVRCVVIDDKLYLDGRLEERTTDWYAQDTAGTVWYFGEKTAILLPNGKVRTKKGSFEAGVDGARQGIYMPAHPAVGGSYQQESYPGHAEDHFKIVSLSGVVSTPAVSSKQAMVTRETTPLEPAVVDSKTYVRGVGTVLEEELRGGVERLELVSSRQGP